MDGSKIVACSAAAVTIWAMYRVRESSLSAREARRARRYVNTQAANANAAKKQGTLPTTPTPPAVLSPAIVPTLKNPPNNTTELKTPAPTPAPISKKTTEPAEPAEPKHAVPPPESKKAPEKKAPESAAAGAAGAEPKRSLKPRKQASVVPLDLTSESNVDRIDCETLASWLTRGEQPVLVDVRSDDYKGGNVAGAKHLSYTQYHTGKDYVQALSPEPNQKIVFICMYGKEQSPAVAQDFYRACDSTKLPQIHVLHGGFQAWLRYCARADLSKYIADYNQDLWVSQDGGLVYRSDLEESAPGLLRAPSLRHMRMQSSTLRLNLDENHRFEFLDCQTLNLWLASEDKPLTVDVRSEDFKGGNIPGTMHIPFGSFTARVGEVEAALREHKGERANVVVFLCMHGVERSPTCAMKFLTTHNNSATKVYVLRRGFQDWLNYCLASTPMTANQVVEYDPEKWVKQDKLGYVYKTNWPA